LQSWISHLLATNHEIILSLDANSSYNPDTSVPSHPRTFTPAIPTTDNKHDGKLSTLVATCGLVDPLARQHSSRPIPPLHNRGFKRIDFMFVSSNIMSAVVSSWCLSSHSVFNSDHRAYFLDFSAEQLFSDPAYEIERPQYHQLRTQDPRLTEQYRHLLHTKLNYYKVHDKIKELQQAIANNSWTETHAHQYQLLDNTITESMIYAE
jgi:hypothetical protein